MEKTNNIIKDNTCLNFMIRVLLSMTLIWVFSRFYIPLKPVPITMQTLAIYMIGLSSRPIEAIAATSLYLLLVLAGLGRSPGGNILTFGYIVGMVLAAFLMSYFMNYISSHKNKCKKYETIKACLIGFFVIFSFGISWLSYWVGVRNAILSGLFPFIIGEIVKITICFCAFGKTK